MVDCLLNFGFRLCAVTRPSLCLPEKQTTVVAGDVTSSTRRNPIDLFVGSRNGVAGDNWATMAIGTTNDTALLAVIRCNGSHELFARILKVSTSFPSLIRPQISND